MIDFKVDKTGNIVIDPTKDIGVVTGRDWFEQKIMISVQSEYQDIIGEQDPDTVIELIKVGAARVARSMDDIASVSSIDAEYSDTKANTVEVTIVYDTGEELTFEV